MKICRLCLCQNDRLVPILEYKIVDLATKILDCVSIDINSNDGLPKCVCKKCIEQILHWESFRNTCQKSNEILLDKMNIAYKDLENSLINLDVVEIIREEVYNKHNKYKNQIKEEEEEDEYTSFDEDKTEVRKFKSLNDFLDIPDGDLIFEEKTVLYECDFCHLQFDNCFDFLDHQYVHNGKDIFKCDKCPETFSTREEIVYHERTHRIACQHCGKLILRSSMKLHLVKHTDKYKCSECYSLCNSRAALRQHIITVHTDIREYICEVCGKSFSSKSAMSVHYKIHSDNRMYSCKECSYAGRTASALYIHMSTHANDTCICDKCSKTFKSRRNLNDHLRRAHSQIKKHHCGYCKKSFVDKYMLKVHTRWHTNVRPYKCNVCSKAFIRSDGLKEHMNTHTKRIVVNCIGCGKKFASRQGLARHSCLLIS